MKKLDNDAIQKHLNNLQGWEVKGEKIEKSFKLKDFVSVINFVNKVADEAEKMNHHPDINIHSWNNVVFSLSTHSEGGITQNDIKLAEKIETLK